MVETRNQTRLREQQSKLIEKLQTIENRVQSMINLNKQMEDTQRLANLESPWPTIFSHGSSNVHSQRSSSSMSEALTTYPTPTQPPDPHDHKITLTSKTSRNKLFPLKYSYDEIDDRITNGLCIFCEEQDIPSHQLKHKNLRIVMVESEDDELADDNEPQTGFKLEAMETNVSVQEIASSCSKGMPTTEAIQDEESSPKSESKPDHLIKEFSSSEVFISDLEQVRRKGLQPHNGLSLIEFPSSYGIESFSVPQISLKDGNSDKQMTCLATIDGVFMIGKGISEFSLCNRVWKPGEISAEQIHGGCLEVLHGESKAFKLRKSGCKISFQRDAKEFAQVVEKRVHLEGFQSYLLVNLKSKDQHLLIVYAGTERHIISGFIESLAGSKEGRCEDAYLSINGVRAEKISSKRPHDPGIFNKQNQNEEQYKQPGGVLIEQKKSKGFYKCDKLMRPMQELSTMWRSFGCLMEVYGSKYGGVMRDKDNISGNVYQRKAIFTLVLLFSNEIAMKLKSVGLHGTSVGFRHGSLPRPPEDNHSNFKLQVGGKTQDDLFLCASLTDKEQQEDTATGAKMIKVNMKPFENHFILVHCYEIFHSPRPPEPFQSSHKGFLIRFNELKRITWSGNIESVEATKLVRSYFTLMIETQDVAEGVDTVKLTIKQFKSHLITCEIFHSPRPSELSICKVEEALLVFGSLQGCEDFIFEDKDVLKKEGLLQGILLLIRFSIIRFNYVFYYVGLFWFNN